MTRSRLLSLLVSLLLAAGLWFLLARPVDIGVDWHGDYASASFAPFREGQSPLRHLYPTHEQIEADLLRLKGLFRGIRTYTALEGMAEIPELAAKHGLKLTHSAWLGRDAKINEAEVDALIQAANTYPQAVERVIVGNEVLLRRDLSRDELIAYIDRVRAAVKQPVSYADVWAFWLKNPQLAEHVDFITIHILPYWEDEPVAAEDAEARFAEVIGKIRAAFPGKPILIGEAGWPSEGRSRGPAVADLPSAAYFVRELPRLAAKYQVDYNVVEAYDQPWKAQLEGTMGARWGLYDIDRQLKFERTGPVEPFPQALPRAVTALVLGTLLGLLLVPSTALPLLAFSIALACQALAAGSVETLWHIARVAISPTSLTWFLQRGLFLAADAGWLDKPTVGELYRALADSAPGAAELWAGLRLVFASLFLLLSVGLARARCAGRRADALARLVRASYLSYCVGAIAVSLMLALNGRYMDIPTPEFWITLLTMPLLALSNRAGKVGHGLAFATLTHSGRLPRWLPHLLLLCAAAVIIGEGWAVAGEDFMAMHPSWGERLPLILKAMVWNREILGWAAMLVALSIPLWRRNRAPAVR